LSYAVDIDDHDHIVLAWPTGDKDDLDIDRRAWLDQIATRFDIEFFLAQFTVAGNTQLELERDFAGIGEFHHLAIRERITHFSVVNRLDIELEIRGHDMPSEEDLEHFTGTAETETEGF
jgi:hypothetical protein